jgi:hypothetical protein
LRREAESGTESVGEDTADATSESAGADNAGDEARKAINGALDLATDVLASLELSSGSGLGVGSRGGDGGGNEAEGNDRVLHGDDERSEWIGSLVFPWLVFEGRSGERKRKCKVGEMLASLYPQQEATVDQPHTIVRCHEAHLPSGDRSHHTPRHRLDDGIIWATCVFVRGMLCRIIAKAL